MIFSNLDFDFEVIYNAIPYLFKEGMTFTLKLTILATIGGVILGTILAMMRMITPRQSRPTDSGLTRCGNCVLNVLPWIATTYVNLLRSIPLLMVIFWFYFLVPYIGAWLIGAKEPIAVGTFWSSLITFTLFEAAFFCEIMRAGIQAISRGQMAAGYAMGLNYFQVMGSVVLPQVFRNMIPLLLTQTIILFQDTSLVYVLGITDFMGAASKIAQGQGRLVEMYVFAAIVYFVICFALSRLVKILQQRVAIIR